MMLKKPKLGELCLQHKPKPVYQVSEIAKGLNCKILIAPVGHPEPNPIEMVWVHMKQYIAKCNITLSLKEVEKYAHEALDTFESAKWQSYVCHCIKMKTNT